MIEIENVSFYYQGNEQMGAVNHLSLFYTKGASSGSLRRIWMWKNHSHTAYEWPDPQFL